jgi:hypothetical protein
LEAREDKYIKQLDTKEIDEEKFWELISELDLERAMAKSVAEGLATMQVTTQDEDASESEREESVEEEPVAAEVVIESLTVRKGKQKAAPTRAKVYVAVDELVSALLNSTSICANIYAYSATSALCRRQSRNVSLLHCHTLIKCVSRCAGSVLNQAVSGCSGKLNYSNYINHLFKDITKC